MIQDGSQPAKEDYEGRRRNKVKNLRQETGQTGMQMLLTDRKEKNVSDGIMESTDHLYSHASPVMTERRGHSGSYDRAK